MWTLYHYAILAHTFSHSHLKGACQFGGEDVAMGRSKELGKARVEVYDKAMHARVSERMHMGTALRQVALKKEFRLHYQPVISLKTGHIVGFEPLVRWYTPDQGILNTADFIDAIDTAGLIYSTDHWLLQTA